MNRLLSSSRYLILIAVVATLVSATVMLVLGAAATIQAIVTVFATSDFSSKVVKSSIVTFVEIVDVFLLATVLYIIAVGLYELFIDNKVDVPAWLEIHTLDDLKDKLIGVVVVVLGVNFLGQFVGWDGQSTGILAGGISVAIVIAALTFFLREKPKEIVKKSGGAPEDSVAD